MNSTRVIDFVEERIESMLQRPGLWGEDTSVEDQILSLLEVYHVAKGNDSDVMHRYTQFLAEMVPGLTGGLASASDGQISDFTRLLRKFVNQEMSSATRKYCGRVGGPVTFEGDRCPECGYSDHMTIYTCGKFVACDDHGHLCHLGIGHKGPCVNPECWE